ncbi:MAG TPA: histidine phosphatase family protein [Thermoanaerobaculia bacterium]|nr:histidine phosphatase family protein [Thermoanaerobaculia bacterium]
MFALLLRHGIAHPRGTKPEEERDLTDIGHRRMKRNARGLTVLFPKAEVLLSSPLIRCVQTAEWVVKAYGGKLKIETRDELRPEGDRNALRKLIGDKRVIIVGHEPWLSESIKRPELELKKGGIYGLRVNGDELQLEWMIPPRALRRLRTS